LHAQHLVDLDPRSALTATRRHLRIAPDAAAGHRLLGVLCRAHAEGDALLALRRAGVLGPNMPGIYASLAEVAQGAGASDRAVALWRHELQLDPGAISSHAGLGAWLLVHGRADDARAALTRAVLLDPAGVDQQGNYGLAVMAAGRLGEAATGFLRVRRVDPQSIPGLVNLGILARDGGLLEDGERLLRAAACVAPDRAEALQHLGLTVERYGAVDLATRYLRRALMVDPDFARAHSNLIFQINHLPDISDAEVLATTLEWGARQAALPRAATLRLKCDGRTGPLRVGVLSAELHTHPIAYNIEDLLNGLVRGPFELFVYADMVAADATTARLQALVGSRWRRLDGMEDRDVARMIAADGIDILVLVAPHSGHNRPGVATYRPACVMMSFGELGSTGLSEIDYWISDPIHHPPGLDPGYPERLIRLPVFTLHRPPENAPMPVADGRAAGPIMFGSFNKPAKINAAVIALWARVLRAVPDSALLLKFVNYYRTSAARERILSMFAREGVDGSRLVFEAAAEPRSIHLDRLRRVDIALDPFPFNGCTTTFEALWMGVPVVSLAGSRFVSRLGAGILIAAGLDELVASDGDNYVRIAVELAGNHSRLVEYRRTLRSRLAGSPLCRPEAYVEAFAATLRDLALKHRLRDA
jgi:predicted O-linked N-acetylglucosamine transferase (SPINDLY family)